MAENWDPLKAAYTLYETTIRQQKQNDALLRDLQALAHRYELAVNALPAKVAEGVNQGLPQAATLAAERIAANWTEANAHAEAATAAYVKAEKIAPWLLFGAIGIGTLFVALLGIYVSQRMLPNAQQIADLQIKQQTLLANIQALEQRGGSASLAYCHGPSRKQELCILVDANTKTNLPGYRIIVTK